MIRRHAGDRRDPVLVIQEQLDEWDVAFVELDVFGTSDAGRIAELVNRFTCEQLGSGVAGYLRYGSSVGSTHCVELLDGRRVVVKARPYWIAYGAWISIAPGETEWPEDSWPALLREVGERLLA